MKAFKALSASSITPSEPADIELNDSQTKLELVEELHVAPMTSAVLTTRTSDSEPPASPILTHSLAKVAPLVNMQKATRGFDLALGVPAVSSLAKGSLLKPRSIKHHC